MPARLHPLPATASEEAGQPLKLKEEQPDGKSHSSSFSSILGVTTTPKEKEKVKQGSQAPEPPLQLANLVRRRRGRRAIPSREKNPKVIARSESGAKDTVYTHEAEVSARKNKDGEGVMNRSGSGSFTQPERDGGTSSRDQEPGRPGSPAPNALESGRTTGRRRHDLDRETHPEASTSGSHHFNLEENKPTL